MSSRSSNLCAKKPKKPPSKEQEEEVLRILHNAFNVFLHNPTLNLKDLSHHEEGDIIIEALQNVFTDKTQSNLLNRYKCEYDTTL